SSGTTRGTRLVADPFADNQPFPDVPINLTAVGRLVYFTPNNSPQLWVTDGTAPGTRLLKDFTIPGTVVDIPANLTAVGHELFFTEFTPDGVEQLWASDGTPAGARLVADDVTYVYGSGVALGRELYFISVDPTTFAAQLWQSDGTAAGTRVADPAHPGTQ